MTRAVVFHVDPSPAQERLLRSYCGASRFAYNWVLGEVTGNLTARAVEREAGVDEGSLTASVSWSKYSLRKQFNAVKSEVASWSGEVAKRCFDTGVSQAAAAWKNWSDWKSGARAGKHVGFPSFQSRHRAKLSVTFVELNHQLSWLNDSRHGVRLMLPQALIQSKDPHTRRCAKLTRGHRRPDVLRHARQWLPEGRTKRPYRPRRVAAVLRLGRDTGNGDRNDSIWTVGFPPFVSSCCRT